MDLIKFCTREMPQWNCLSVNGYDMREAGATAVQEVAFALSIGIATVDACVQAGLRVDDFGPRISFFFAVDNHFFEEIAKLRAVRRMWAKVMRERFGARNPKAWLLKMQTQTAGSSLTAQEPLNNIARVALQALAAVLGGTQSLHTGSYDEAVSIPTDEAVRIAVHTQKIVEHETGVTDVADPLGGSYYLEYLTHEVERRAWEYISKIQAMGGALATIESGYMEREIASASARHQEEIARGQRIVVGVNKCHDPNATASVPAFARDPRVEETAVRRMRELREARDNQKVHKALDDIRRAASTGADLMPLFIEGARCYATLGEMMGVLRQVFGPYQAPLILAGAHA